MGTDRGRRGIDVVADHHGGIGIDIRLRAGQQVKRGAGQRILIGAPVDRLTLQLFGRRVGRGAHRHVGRGQPRRIVDAPRDAEIGEKDSARLPVGVAQQDVGRLDIAVQQPSVMRVIQRRATAAMIGTTSSSGIPPG